MDRSTVTRALGETRPLLAGRGCHIAAGLPLRTLADVVAHLGSTGQIGIIDATEIRVRRPAARHPGHGRYVSGKSRMNAMKALVVTDARGWLLFCGEVRTLAPEAVFTFLIHACGSIALLIYVAIVVSQLRLRKILERNGEAMPVKMWLYPYLTWFTLLLLAGILVAMLALPGTRKDLVTGLIAPCEITAIYFLGPHRVGTSGC